ncbi:MAG: hypothetical protein K2L18_11415 [Acetatifactor sp.]|nr:hypothetical protein [Acetatifactor sp.]
MKKELEQALEQVRQGEAVKAEQVVAWIKALPRDEDGVFDLSGVEGMQEAGRALYPVYAAYESQCNKKEGYPDILQQMRVMDARLQEHYDMQEAAVYMDTALGTLRYIDQQIYEYYRELMDLYKKNVRRFIKEFYGEGGLQSGGEPAGEAEAMFRESVRQACREHILLKDKYGMYC